MAAATKAREAEVLKHLEANSQLAVKLMHEYLTLRYEARKESLVSEGSESNRGRALELKDLIRKFSTDGA